MMQQRNHPIDQPIQAGLQPLPMASSPSMPPAQGGGNPFQTLYSISQMAGYHPSTLFGYDMGQFQPSNQIQPSTDISVQPPSANTPSAQGQTPNLPSMNDIIKSLYQGIF